MSSDIIQFVDEHQQAQIGFLKSLIKVPSDNPPGDCAPHGARAAELLTSLGFEVERHRVPDALCQANGMISAMNLIVRRRYGDGPVIALNAHGDVVAPGAGWSVDPYAGVEKDGFIYGRGAAVSKSDFATYAFAVLALEQVSKPASGSIELHFTYDEEVGGKIGPKWILDEGLSNPDYAVSAGFTYNVVTAHNGCLHLELVVRGKSAHAAKPETGCDALEATAAILTAIYDSRKSLLEICSDIPGIGTPKINVGLIQGGINTTVVPDCIRMRVDRRLIPEEDPVVVEDQLHKIIKKSVLDRRGITVDIQRIMLAEPFMPVGNARYLADVFSRHASRTIGEVVSLVGVPIFTDARHYAAAGIPTILFGAGPRSIEEANSHRADERVQIDDLRHATVIVASALSELLVSET